MMLTRLLVILVTFAGIAGCGSTRTLSSDNVARVDDLQLKGTGCGDTLPRVYGGVVYNLCVMSGDSHPRGGPLYAIAPMNVPMAFLDMGVSAVADTLTLPYTLYRQNQDGDIQLLRD
ncbi:YceK/YidQ family lipoprotein [Pseudomonas sp. PDM20]|uniref:YceK/YidQ family lipoprotein n=1 Tax=Pseudomonas sp. PDM20 TaxID=2769254 RepID=UPI0017861496|nr:YceK/YidQ family lipoprotein [Pseudomonas sp. PDM20]